MAINQANIVAVITAEDKASSVLKSFGSEVDKTAVSATGSLNRLTTSYLAVIAATAGLVAFGKKSLDAWNQQDVAVARLRGGIQNVTSATDKSVDGLLKQAAALQKVTRFSDEQIISAQGILATDQLNQDVIAKLTPRLIDMSEGLARVTGEMPDLESNAALVAKAIGGEDTDSLVGTLRRANVLLTRHQIEVLKTGTVQERVAAITEALDQNFKDLGTTIGSTTAGKMTELKNQFNELEESVGSVIATALTPLLNILNAHPAILAVVTAAVGTLTVAFVGMKVATVVSLAIQGLSAALGVLTGAASIATGALTTMSAFISGPGLLAIGPFVAALAVIAGSYWAIQNAASAAKSAIDNTTNSVRSASNSDDAVIKNLQNLIKNGTPEQQQRAKITLSKLASTGTFASGGFTGAGGVNDVAGVVHKGEFVLPQSMVNQSTGQPRIGGNLNITIQTGALMGNDVEARKFAQLIMKHYQDAMGSKSKAVMA